MQPGFRRWRPVACRFNVRDMGYTLVLIIGAAVVLVLLVAMMSGRKRPVGRTAPGNDITPKMPSAEYPTPDASKTASRQTSDTAQRHTPPA